MGPAECLPDDPFVLGAALLTLLYSSHCHGHTFNFQEPQTIYAFVHGTLFLINSYSFFKTQFRPHLLHEDPMVFLPRSHQGPLLCAPIAPLACLYSSSYCTMLTPSAYV